MNQIQCDVAGCQERERADGGYSWTEVKCGEISNKGVALEYTIKHVCPKCRSKFYNLFLTPALAAAPALAAGTPESGLFKYPDGTLDVR
jgi:hypothetical protein